MKLTIHRGAREIGGTVISLSTHNTTILLDTGLPLSANSHYVDIRSLCPDAVIISHPHQDHYGLIDQLDPAVPVYMGAVAVDLIIATKTFIRRPVPENIFYPLKKNEAFTVGDFIITPFLVDHSSVDAYAFLIEAEGRQVFYTGDFRSTGNKGFLFDDLITRVPSGVDMMLMEGTMMRRNSDAFPDEASVRRKIESVLSGQQNISFLISSSQNIDRLVSAAIACKNTNRYFVVDIYTAWVLEKIKPLSSRTPTIEWDQIKVYADFGPNEIVKNNPSFFGDFKKRIYQNRVTKEELKASPEKYVVLSRMYKTDIMDRYKSKGPINLIYSQWLGYLSPERQEECKSAGLAAYQDDPFVNFIYAHTSGHATRDVLLQLTHAVKPKKLIPIHTEFPEDYSDVFDNVVQLNDMETLIIGE